jgi:hypothetical protein
MERGDCSEDCFEDFIDVGVDPDPKLLGQLGSGSEAESDLCCGLADPHHLDACPDPVPRQR